ncbi:phage gp6-like head-tail connector protein [Streptomyces europaeiscabiei]|uniref:head-tail connector protein n=1 Tax=Streptomyces europaeiscabiei TaxID=146819 RepID=UPI0029B5630C|nr:head-tail connector protein [Streptomyces europaeiscabiei]MDX3629048.1 phage gp6-like head-tail connector protein [Streptomyces europaeiscabiei]MDX3647334.1 phage gp6-like head-tail connector protein [Streptomyces europaeiscabiei]
MITAAAGSNVALVFAAGAVLTDPTVTIAPTAGGAAVIGPTANGLGVASTTYTYVWQVSSAQAQASYTATLAGTSGGEPVEVEVEVYVTALPLYATLAQLKNMMGITDSDRDGLLVDKLSAACRSIDDTTGRRFYLDTVPSARVINPTRRLVQDEDGWHLMVPDIGDLDDLVVEVGRTDSWTDVTSRIEAEPTDAMERQEAVTSLLMVGGSWPVGGGARARVTTRWGWPIVKPQIGEASLLLGARLVKRKDSPEGVLGSSEWGVIRLSRTDPDVYALIQRFILPGLA